MLFSREGTLRVYWLAATLNEPTFKKKFKREDIDKIKIHKQCEYFIIKINEKKFTLYQAAQLVYGTIKIFSYQVFHIFDNTQKFAFGSIVKRSSIYDLLKSDIDLAKDALSTRKKKKDIDMKDLHDKFYTDAFTNEEEFMMDKLDICEQFGALKCDLLDKSANLIEEIEVRHGNGYFSFATTELEDIDYRSVERDLEDQRDKQLSFLSAIHPETRSKKRSSTSEMDGTTSKKKIRLQTTHETPHMEDREDVREPVVSDILITDMVQQQALHMKHKEEMIITADPSVASAFQKVMNTSLEPVVSRSPTQVAEASLPIIPTLPISRESEESLSSVSEPPKSKKLIVKDKRRSTIKLKNKLDFNAALYLNLDFMSKQYFVSDSNTAAIKNKSDVEEPQLAYTFLFDYLKEDMLNETYFIATRKVEKGLPEEQVRFASDVSIAPRGTTSPVMAPYRSKSKILEDTIVTIQNSIQPEMEKSRPSEFGIHEIPEVQSQQLPEEFTNIQETIPDVRAALVPAEGVQPVAVENGTQSRWTPELLLQKLEKHWTEKSITTFDEIFPTTTTRKSSVTSAINSLLCLRHYKKVQVCQKELYDTIYLTR